jgi:hypothetical protein
MLSRARQIGEKSGAFNALFCVGQFFGTGNELEAYTSGSEKGALIHSSFSRLGLSLWLIYLLTEYILGANKRYPSFGIVTTPTFFVTLPEEEKHLPSSMPPSGELCENLTYLGACGSREVQGLQVAFFNGTREGTNRADFDAQRFGGLLSRSRSSTFKGVDILLTNHWSRGLLSNLKDLSIVGLATTEMSSFGIEAVSELAEALTPRYHFAASPTHVAFERAPYTNDNFRPFTRFVALSEAFNPRKQKFMYAFNISPLPTLSAAELSTPPATGSTPSPFAFLKAAKEAELEQANAKKRKFDDLDRADAKQGTQLFYDDKRAQRGQQYHERQARAAEDHERQYQDRKRSHNERINQEARDPSSAPSNGDFRPRRPRTEYSKSRFDRNDPRMQQKMHPLMQRNGCWFCLSNPNVEEHLVVSIGDHYYLALAKGGVTNDHLLIVPIEHSGTMESINEASIAELKRFQSALVACYQKQDMDVIFWERKLDAPQNALASTSDKNHAQLQALALPKDSFVKIRAGFDSQLEHFGLLFLQLEDNQQVSSLTGNTGHLFVDMPSLALPTEDVPSPPTRSRSLAIIPDKKRIPLQLPRRVISQALEKPEREDWKACVLSKSDEEHACSDVKETFGPFDFTLM